MSLHCWMRPFAIIGSWAMAFDVAATIEPGRLTPSQVLASSSAVVVGTATGYSAKAVWDFDGWQQEVVIADFRIDEVVDGPGIRAGDVIRINLRGGASLPLPGVRVGLALQADDAAERRGADGYVAMEAMRFPAADSAETDELRQRVARVRGADAETLAELIRQDLEASGQGEDQVGLAEAPAIAAGDRLSEGAGDQTDPVRASKVDPVQDSTNFVPFVLGGVLAAGLVFAARRRPRKPKAPRR